MRVNYTPQRETQTILKQILPFSIHNKKKILATFSKKWRKKSDLKISRCWIALKYIRHKKNTTTLMFIVLNNKI